ncbi:BMP family lipoprotein [Eremococcus coleocola]|uniref:Basic membrane protein n=1 Tax=Eremococcus coleocola ACS-139-V-Col8 TaxID=908337 RepID=E4KLY4_9LACT|nr:BMP family protein [Eremococcus coleocola]EFR32074.1 basic membrane protein [Eremococcus coleocola ACS-139-V-Col8]
MKKFGIAALTLSLLSPGMISMVQAQEDFSAIMITDQGGIDDKSFNQSAWEGLQAWGKENGKEKGAKGFDYLESDEDSQYVTNINTAVQAGFDIIYGVGFKLQPAIEQIAGQQPDQKFAVVDSFVDAPNVASINFRANEAAYLAGAAAALSSETGHIGFVGGAESEVIDAFEAGFVAGAKAVKDDIEVTVEYVGSFADAPKAKQIASAMYANDIDVIYQAAGESGNGVFSEAKDLVAADSSRNLWVIGADRDQTEEGTVTVDGKERTLTLTSTLKKVGETMHTFTNEVMNGNFKSGLVEYGLDTDSVGITDGQLSEDILKQVNDLKNQIIDGKIEVPTKP